MELVACHRGPGRRASIYNGGHSDAEFAGQGRGAFGGGLDERRVAGVVRANLCNLMSMGPPLVDIFDATHDSRRV